MNHRHQVFIHTLEEEVLVCTLQEHNPLEQLKNEIFTKTGIKPSVQRLMHQQKLITSDQALLELGPNCNLFLTVALRGGSGECDVCFSKGEFTCAECENQIMCKECCERVHKHPRRAQYEPSPLQIQPLQQTHSQVRSLNEAEAAPRS